MLDRRKEDREASVYKHPYDDPYRLLARKILCIYGLPMAIRVLNDNKLIRRMVVKETKEQDLIGAFLDCVISDLYETHRRMEYVSKLDILGRWFYEKLDKARLRRELRAVIEEFGLSDLIEK